MNKREEVERNDKRIMEENKKKKNISFPKKVWYSITKFEQYPTMATDGIWNAIRYLMVITAIVAIFSMVGTLIKLNKSVWKISEYIEQNIPDFTFEDGKVSMDIDAPVIIKDFEYNAIEKIIINPLADTDESKEQSEKDEMVSGITLFFFKDQIVLKSKMSDENIQTQEYTYNDFIANYTKEDITSFNKADLVNYMRSSQIMPFYASYALTAFIGLFITGLVYALLDTVRVAIFGWITAVIAKIKMKFVAIYNMAVYAFTLPMILEIIYIIINYFVDFKIKYFQVAYTTIAFIYLAAAIFILKDDFIKKMQEVMRIKQEQKNVREEIQKQEEKNDKPEDDENQDQKEKKENNDEDEPQGSEA